MSKSKSKLSIAASFIAASVFVFASCSKEKIAVNAAISRANTAVKSGILTKVTKISSLTGKCTTGSRLNVSGF